MSFSTSIKNTPEEAIFWMPTFYYRDPVTGAYTPYYPAGYLDIEQSWLCPLSAGKGIMVDYRCIIYNVRKGILGTRDLHNIVVKDDVEFVYNWGAGGLNIWTILPWGLVGVLGIILIASRKR